MTSRITGCLLIGLAPLLGCRASQLRDAYIIEAFSAEVRVLEDKLYEFDDRLDKLERRIENVPAPPENLEPRAPRAATPRPAPRTSPPASLPPEIPDLTPPEIDPGSPVGPDELDDDAQSRLTRPRNQLASRTTPLDPHLARIEISPFTRPVELDELPGVDGIDLVVLPLNLDGEVVPPEGKLKVVVVDPVERKWLAKFECDEEATAARFREQGAEAGIQVQIKFPEPLKNTDLHLFVRLETPAGERIETEGPFKAEKSTPRLGQRWTQRTSASPQRTATQPVTPQGPPPEVYR